MILVQFAIFALITHHINSLCLNFFHLLAQKPNLEKKSIYSNKFFHNFHLSESSFTCPMIQASAVTIKRIFKFILTVATGMISLKMIFIYICFPLILCTAYL